MRPRRAVFLDRDGVIIEEVHYLRRLRQMRLVPGAARAIAALKAAGYKTVIISNQSAVARGLVTEKELRGIHRVLQERLAKYGGAVHAIYYCPHHPKVGDKVKCQCRKPKTGMIEAAARRFGLDVRNSYLIGDTTTDMLTAKNAGCRGVLVRTGKAGRDGCYKAKPYRIFRDLPAATEWIVSSDSTMPPRSRPSPRRS